MNFEEWKSKNSNPLEGLSKARSYYDFKVPDGRYFPSSSEVLYGGAAIEKRKLHGRSENVK